MLKKEKIIELLETLHEHKMAKDIFAPALKAAGLRGVRFTGGTEEQGIDLEYYELTEPERRKSYVGIQFKKGSLVYQSDAGSKNSVQTVKNQAEEAFSKDMVDIEGHGTHFIGRFIVAVTREINEPARRMIGKARTRGEGRRIDFWDGDRLAETIQTRWMAEFEEYFADALAAGDDADDEEDVPQVIDAAFIATNHEDAVVACIKLRKTLDRGSWAVLRGLVQLSAFGPDGDVSSYGGPRMMPVSELLLELGKTEERLRTEFDDLARYGYIDWGDDAELRISGNAVAAWELARSIVTELADADEDKDAGGDIFDELVP